MMMYELFSEFENFTSMSHYMSQPGEMTHIKRRSCKQHKKTSGLTEIETNKIRQLQVIQAKYFRDQSGEEKEVQSTASSYLW